MADMFRLKLVSKRQVTIPQRVMDLLGLQLGDEIHLKISNGKIVQAYPVNISPNLEMSEDARQRFAEIESEIAIDQSSDLDISNLMDQYAADANKVGVRTLVPGENKRARSLGELFVSRIAPRNFRISDERIVERVAEWLADAQLDVSEVEVLVKAGEVTLRGSMSDKKSRLMAELVTRNVLGVSEVHNEIEVEARPGTSNPPGSFGIEFDLRSREKSQR